jgi:dihydrofolate reductase
VRNLILRMTLTFDGISPGKDGGTDMVDFSDEESWSDIFATLERVDTMLIGGNSQQEYLSHWQQASKDPKASANEHKYGEIAMRTPHFVVSRSLQKAATPNATILSRGVDGIADLKRQPGRDLLMWGGTTVAAATIDAGFVDEYHFEVHPAIAARGRKLFADVVTPRRLRHIQTTTFRSGVFVIKYANR